MPAVLSFLFVSPHDPEPDKSVSTHKVVLPSRIVIFPVGVGRRIRAIP